jgi:hypothetical protein
MRALTACAAFLSLPGCYMVYDDSAPPPVDTAPYITYADAGCFWDDYYRDDVWYFDADVDDVEGAKDIVAVYVDVYDTWDGAWVDGFDLYYEGGITWYSAWVGHSTYLSCGYPDYVVDFTAVDSWGDADVVSVYPAFY